MSPIDQIWFKILNSLVVILTLAGNSLETEGLAVSMQWLSYNDVDNNFVGGGIHAYLLV